MGSLTSRPKVPQIQPQPFVSVPQQNNISPSSPLTPAPVISTPSAPQTNNITNNNITLPVTTDAARVENLLRRNRGVGGTILTGFRGLLSSNTLTPQRKTLLGE